MVQITEVNREPATTVSTLTATTEVTSPSVTADSASVTNAVDAGSVTTDALESTGSIIDASGDTHTGELADRDGDDLTPDTIDFATSITDAEGNTVTSLSDPVRVTEEASAFTESNVTLSNNNTVITNGSVALPTEIIIDDFEDGDTTTTKASEWDGWTVTAGTFTAQQNTVISGSFTGEYETTDAFVESVQTNRVPARAIKKLSIKLQIGSVASDDVRLFVRNENADGAIDIDFDDTDQDIDVPKGGSKLRDWTAGTTYNITLSIDYTNDEFDVNINGTDEGTFSFLNSSSKIEKISIINNTTTNSETRSVFIDDVIESETANSGDALVSFDSGSPADIDSWDLATFQRTLDNETVTVDVVEEIPVPIKLGYFEDGDATIDASGFSGWGSAVTAQQNTVISGSYSGEITTTGGSSEGTATSDTTTTDDIEGKIRIGTNTGNTGDDSQIYFETGGSIFFKLVFVDGGPIEVAGASITELESAWNADQTYSYKFLWDFENDEVEIYLNGTSRGTYSLATSLSGWDVLTQSTQTSTSNTTRSIYIDDIGIPDATTEINPLFDDISQNFDISTVDTNTNVKLRANLSRNDTANNPTLDYLARRFTR